MIVKGVAICHVRDLAMPDVLGHVKHHAPDLQTLCIPAKTVIIHAKRHARINVPVLVKVLVLGVREHAKINVREHVRAVVVRVLAVAREVVKTDVKKAVLGLAVITAYTLVILLVRGHVPEVVIILAPIHVKQHAMVLAIILAWG